MSRLLGNLVILRIDKFKKRNDIKKKGLTFTGGELEFQYL